jgi:hypothetical protein
MSACCISVTTTPRSNYQAAFAASGSTFILRVGVDATWR